MASPYLGVYRAIYEYSAQHEDELSVQTDDLLYLLEKSDVDDWWTVKKRVLPVGDEQVDEPEGLIPLNYVEEVCVEMLASEASVSGGVFIQSTIY